MKDSLRELEHAAEKLEDRVDDTGGGGAEDVTVEWRDADPAERPAGLAWDPEDHRLVYDLWEAQRDALEAVNGGADIAAFLAGYGAGKTIFGARWLVKQALEHPGSRFLALGIDFSKARDTTFRVLFEQLPGDRTGLVAGDYNGPETSPVVADYNRQSHRLTLVNDTVITLGAADQWNRYAGDEYGAVWLDEPSHYGEDLHNLLEMIGSRLRGVAGPKAQLWTLTGNGYNPAWEILHEQEDESGAPIGLDIELIRASTLDNPYLDDADKDRFRRQYEDTTREEQALHGGFAAAQGLVYGNFSRDRHVIPDDEARERTVPGERIYGYDAGWSDPRVLLEIGRTEDEQLVVLDEFHRSSSHVEDAIRWLDGRPQGVIYAEHEPSDIEKLNAAGWRAEKAKKSLDGGIAEVRQRFKDDGNGGVATLFTGGVEYVDDRDDDAEADEEPEPEEPPPNKPGLLISERCEHLIRELQGYQEDEVGTSAAVDHCADALRYACMGPGGSVTKVRRRTGTRATKSSMYE